MVEWCDVCTFYCVCDLWAVGALTGPCRLQKKGPKQCILITSTVPKWFSRGQKLVEHLPNISQNTLNSLIPGYANFLHLWKQGFVSTNRPNISLQIAPWQLVTFHSKYPQFEKKPAQEGSTRSHLSCIDRQTWSFKVNILSSWWDKNVQFTPYSSTPSPSTTTILIIICAENQP